MSYRRYGHACTPLRAIISHEIVQRLSSVLFTGSHVSVTILSSATMEEYVSSGTSCYEGQSRGCVRLLRISVRIHLEQFTVRFPELIYHFLTFSQTGLSIEITLE